jgi:hypothetical protein
MNEEKNRLFISAIVTREAKANETSLRTSVKIQIPRVLEKLFALLALLLLSIPLLFHLLLPAFQRQLCSLFLGQEFWLKRQKKKGKSQQAYMMQRKVCMEAEIASSWFDVVPSRPPPFPFAALRRAPRSRWELAFHPRQ